MVAGSASGWVPAAGDLIMLNFDPQAGHEQAGHRPAMVLSPSSYNQATGLSVVVPITSHKKGYPFEVDLPSDLAITGVVLADHVRSVDWRARKAKFKDRAPRPVVSEVKTRVRLLLNL